MISEQNQYKAILELKSFLDSKKCMDECGEMFLLGRSTSTLRRRMEVAVSNYGGIPAQQEHTRVSRISILEPPLGPNGLPKFEYAQWGCSYHTQELAALEALEGDKEVANGSRILFFSDCGSALQRVLGIEGSDWKNMALETVRSVRVWRITCSFTWVSSHQPDGTIPGNANADLEANRARMEEVGSAMAGFLIPITYRKKLLDNYANPNAVREAASISNPNPNRTRIWLSANSWTSSIAVSYSP